MAHKEEKLPDLYLLPDDDESLRKKPLNIVMLLAGLIPLDIRLLWLFPLPLCDGLF